MSVIREIGKRLENTEFDLKIDKINYYSDSRLSFTTAKNSYGLFVWVDIENVVDDILLYSQLEYNKERTNLLKRNYTVSGDIDSIIKDISRLISKVKDLENKIGVNFSNLTTQKIHVYNVTWEDVFKEELLDMFGNKYSGMWKDDIFIELIGVNFIVSFDDDMNYLSVELLQSVSPFEKKVLLSGKVDANNYTKVLENVKSIYEYVKRNYSNLEKIANNIMLGGGLV